MPRVRTEWKGDNTDIYIRRTYEINDLDLTENIFLIYSHDDVFELYLNGEKLVATDLVWKNNVNLKLSDEAKKKLRNGKNVIADIVITQLEDLMWILVYIVKRKMQ